MKYFIYQIEENDCGITCLKMCLARYYNDENYMFINEYGSELSFLNLQNIFSKYNVETTGYKIDLSTLINGFNYSIIHIRESGKNHFVVLRKITKRYVEIIDPINGLRIIDINYFREIYTNNCLKIYYKKTLKNSKKTRSFDVFMIVYILSLIVDFMLVYFLTYIIKSNVIESVILLIFCIAINFIFKVIVLLSSHYSFDRKFLKDDYIKLFSLSQISLITEYKSKRTKYYYSFITYIMIVIFGSIFLIANSLTNSLYLFISFLFAYIKNAILDKNLSIDKEKTVILERNFHKAPKQIYRKMKDKANLYLLKIFLFYTAYGIILLLSSLFLNYFFFNGSLSNLFFSLMSGITIYTLLDKFIQLKKIEIHSLNLLKNRVKKLFFKKKLSFE